MTPRKAYDQYSSAHLWPQLQGDCGVYSFYFATLLLRAMNPSGPYPHVFPRKYKSDSSKNGGVVIKSSIRQWVKSTQGVNSGQGEILTLHEMHRVISNFGYRCTYMCMGGIKDTTEIRRNFIKSELAAGHPVLIAFLEGGAPPACYPATAPAGDTGAHWSLIIDDTGGKYTWIDPHDPVHLYCHPQDTFLKSNATVDSQPLGRYWAKLVDSSDPKFKSLTEIATPTIAPGRDASGYDMDGTTYDINKGGRSQKLNGVMISVS